MNGFYQFLIIGIFAMCLVTVFEVSLLRRIVALLLEGMAKLEEEK